MGRRASTDIYYLDGLAFELHDNVWLAHVGARVFVTRLDTHTGVAEGLLAHSREGVANGVVPVCGPVVLDAGEGEVPMRGRHPLRNGTGGVALLSGG